MKLRLRKIKLLFTICYLCFSIAKAQIINTVAGNGTGGYSGNGGQATAAELYYPNGTQFDPTGILYILDTDNNVVRKVSASGIITTIAGNGIQGYSGDGGQATAAQLNYPRGVSFDGLGNLYITEAFNNRIRKVNSSGIINTFAGTGAAGYSGDGGLASAAKLYTPYVSIFDAIGNMYIADYDNNRVRKINTAGIISTFAGNGTGGYTGDGGQATAAELYTPVALAFDAIGNLIISDGSNHRIRKVNSLGIISTIAGTGVGGFSGDCGQATAAQLNRPFGIAIDAVGNLYIGDSWNNRVRMVNTSGIITTIAGTGLGAYSGDGGPANAAEIYWPSGLTINGLNNLHIADQFNHRIRVINIANMTLSANSPTICAGNTATLTANGGSTTYTWSTGATTASIALSPTVTTTYTVISEVGTCISKAVATINVTPSSSNVTISGTGTICSGENITLTASGASNYVWSTGATTASVTLNPTVTTTYTVTGGLGTCTSQAVATVNIIPGSIINVSGNCSICLGQNTTLTANGVNTYTWNTGANTTSISVSPNITTTYTVMGTSSTCTSQVIATVSVTPTPTITITGNSIICIGQNTTLTANGANSYIWNTGANTSSIMVNPSSFSTYTVIGGIGTCTNQATFTVNVILSSPTVSISGSGTICPGQSATLTANGANTYIWNTGDTTTSIVISPTVTTTYTVTGGIGTCTNQAMATVGLDGVFNFTMPNIITPNNDGINDFIDFGKNQFSTMQLQIYNRWGIRIYESNDPACIWKPTTIDDGTYFYIIQYTITCNREIQGKILKGFITSIK